MDERERALRQRALQHAQEARSILDAGPADGALSAEDQGKYDSHMDEYDRIMGDVARHKRQAEADAILRSPAGDPVVPKMPPGVPAGDGPTGRQRPNTGADYLKAFRRYILGGGLQGLVQATVDSDGRALQMDSDTAGGFAVAPQEFSDQLIKAVDNAVQIRQRATKYRVPNAASLGVPTLTADPDDADWTSELATGNEDSAMAFGKREFRPQPLAKLVKVSNKLLRAAGQLQEFAADGGSTLSVDGLIQDRLAYKNGVSQEKAFLTGTGTLQPLGVFTPSTDGISTARDTTAASTTTFTADELIDVKYALKAQYWTNAAWLMHRLAVKIVRKLKDTDGQYVWAAGGIGQASLANGQPDTILGLPLMVSEYAPSTFTAAQYVAILGDWRFYWIADALDFTVQRLVELYARSNQTGFISRSETDGMPVLEEAFQRLILHA